MYITLHGGRVVVVIFVVDTLVTGSNTNSPRTRVIHVWFDQTFAVSGMDTFTHKPVLTL